MLIIDAHLDLAWNALQWNRNIQHSVYTIRTGESNLSGPGRGQGTVALPEMSKGRVALCFATLLARSTGRTIQGGWGETVPANMAPRLKAFFSR